MKKKMAIAAGAIFGVLVIAVSVNPYFLMLPMLASGRYEAMRGGTPFDEAHQRGVTTFVESKGFGIGRIKKAGLWNEHSVDYEGHFYRLGKIRLIGVTPEFGPRLFQGWYPPRKDQIPVSSYRKLFTDELAVIERLRSSESLQEKLPPDIGGSLGQRRVIAPIFASQDCLRCHSVQVGEMLGALDYSLIPLKWTP